MVDRPVLWRRLSSYAGQAASSPTGVLDGAVLDAEIGELRQFLRELLAWCSSVLSATGGLQAGVVTAPALGAGVQDLLSSGWVVRGVWQAGVQYQLGDVVSVSGRLYVCVTAHTSLAWDADGLAGFWSSIVQPASVVPFSGGGGVPAGFVQGAIEYLGEAKQAAAAVLSSLSAAAVPSGGGIPAISEPGVVSVVSPADVRVLLGLGTAALSDVGDTDGKVVSVVSRGGLAGLPAALDAWLRRALFPVGTVLVGVFSEEQVGSDWLRLVDGTIGNSASNATVKASDGVFELFSALWSRTGLAQCPMQEANGSAVTVKGVSAAADFALNRRISLPRLAGRALGVAGSGAGLTSRAVGLSAGAEAVTLVRENLPAFSMNVPGRAPADHTGPTGNADAAVELTRNTVGTAYTAQNVVSSGGSGVAVSTVPPTAWLDGIIKWR